MTWAAIFLSLLLFGTSPADESYKAGNQAMHKIARVFVNEPGNGGWLSGTWSRYDSSDLMISTWVASGRFYTFSTEVNVNFSVSKLPVSYPETYVFRRRPHP